MSPLPHEELSPATQLIKGHSETEVPRKWNRTSDATLDTIVLPETRSLTNFITTPCKHEVSLMKQTRHTRQASNLFNTKNTIRQTLMRATIGQCESDSAQCSLLTVRGLATMDYLKAHDESLDAPLFCVETLHRYGLLPHDYARISNHTLPETCM